MAPPRLSRCPSPTLPRYSYSPFHSPTFPPLRQRLMAKLSRPLASHLWLRTLRRYDHSPPRTHPRTQFQRTRLATHPLFRQSRPARSTPTPNRPFPTPTRLANVVCRPLRRARPTPRLVLSIPQKTPKGRTRCLGSSPLPAPLFRKLLPPPSARSVPIHHSIRKILHRKLVAHHPRPRNSCPFARNCSLRRLVQL